MLNILIFVYLCPWRQLHINKNFNKPPVSVICACNQIRYCVQTVYNTIWLPCTEITIAKPTFIHNLVSTGNGLTLASWNWQTHVQDKSCILFCFNTTSSHPPPHNTWPLKCHRALIRPRWGQHALYVYITHTLTNKVSARLLALTDIYPGG